MRQLLQNATILLQNVIDVTKCDVYYKLRQYNNQTLRPSKIFTFYNNCICHKYEMKSWFFQRGYLEDLIEMETAKVNFTTLPYKK